MRVYLIGAAAIALAASAALADPGKGHGGGNGGDKGGHAAAGPAMAGGQGKAQGKQDHGKPDKASPVRTAQADRGPSNHGAQAKADRGPERKAAPAAAHGNGHGKVRGNDRSETVRVKTGPARDVRIDRVSDRDRGDSRIVRGLVGFDRDDRRGLIEGCPPGLAKKHNGCQPPGLAKQRGDYRDAFYRPSWFGYPSAGDGRYYYDDGYLYRLNDGGSVLGYIPLLGGALSVGNPWPSYYDPRPVPDYYVEYYNLGQPDSYRYADDVLYRVDPRSDAITSIAALLTGDQFGIGQRMPLGYDVYNVPYAYRDRYYDTPQADYRYADGYIYQVDPTTQLIQAAIQLLT
jgi:hypothetical protein